MKMSALIALLLATTVACSLDAPEKVPSTEAPSVPPGPSAPPAPAPAPTGDTQVSIQGQEILADNDVNQADNRFNIVERNDLERIKDDLAHGKIQEYAKRDENGRLPIHYATSYEAVKLLADIEVVVGRERKGRNTIELKEKALFVADKDGMLPYHAMAAQGRSEALAYALERLCQWWYREELNAKGPNGRTIVHWAVLSRDKATMNALIQCPFISQSVMDDAGQTALHLAVQEEGFAIGWFLISMSPASAYRFQMTMRNKKGLTPMDYAKELHNDVAVQLLNPRTIKPESVLSPWRKN